MDARLLRDFVGFSDPPELEEAEPSAGDAPGSAAESGELPEKPGSGVRSTVS